MKKLTEDKLVSQAMSLLVRRRNEVYGADWRKENAKKASEARWGAERTRKQKKA